MKLTPINGNTETEGVEFIYMGAKLIVARANNIEYKKEFRKLMQPIENEVESGRITEQKSQEVLDKCAAKTILVGWSDFKDMDGEEWEYTEQNAVDLLKDDRDAYREIMKFSENIDNYLIKSQEDLTGK